MRSYRIASSRKRVAEADGAEHLERDSETDTRTRDKRQDKVSRVLLCPGRATGCRLPAAGCRLPATGYRLPATGFRRAGSNRGELAILEKPLVELPTSSRLRRSGLPASTVNVRTGEHVWIAGLRRACSNRQRTQNQIEPFLGPALTAAGEQR